MGYFLGSGGRTAVFVVFHCGMLERKSGDRQALGHTRPTISAPLLLGASTCVTQSLHEPTTTIFSFRKSLSPVRAGARREIKNHPWWDGLKFLW
jgi:hypothetical protein